MHVTKRTLEFSIFICLYAIKFIYINIAYMYMYMYMYTCVYWTVYIGLYLLLSADWYHGTTCTCSCQSI